MPLEELEGSTPAEFCIDRDSLLVSRGVECFVACGPKGIRQARGEEPQVQYFPFAILLTTELAREVANISPLRLAALMAERFPPLAAADAGKEIATRLLLGHFHPSGSRAKARVTAEKSSGIFEVVVTENLGYVPGAGPSALPPVGRANMRELREEAPDRQEVGYETKGERLAVDPEERVRESQPSLLDEAAEDFAGESVAAVASASTKYQALGMLEWLDEQRPPIGSLIEAQIQGLVPGAFTSDAPRVRLAWPDRETRYKKFVKRYRVGQALNVVALPELSGGSRIVLREVDSGLEVELPPDEADALVGDIAKLVWPQLEVPPVTVTKLDAATQRVTVSLRPAWEPWLRPWNSSQRRPRRSSPFCGTTHNYGRRRKCRAAISLLSFP